MDADALADSISASATVLYTGTSASHAGTPMEQNDPATGMGTTTASSSVGCHTAASSSQKADVLESSVNVP